MRAIVRKTASAYQALQRRAPPAAGLFPSPPSSFSSPPPPPPPQAVAQVGGGSGASGSGASGSGASGDDAGCGSTVLRLPPPRVGAKRSRAADAAGSEMASGDAMIKASYEEDADAVLASWLLDFAASSPSAERQT
jgi:hypothetical protein